MLLARLPRARHAATSQRDWWTTKLEANRTRDTDTDRLLQEAGWRVVRIWEHESVEDALDMLSVVLTEVQEAAGPDR